mmetsp:Transcript_24134/g.56891  ORF Transcript_24134/g.56891 Transcript_24134/m.56891 type:complete len:118 (-) Transcript_24134:117-470(-)
MSTKALTLVQQWILFVVRDTPQMISYLCVLQVLLLEILLDLSKTIYSWVSAQWISAQRNLVCGSNSFLLDAAAAAATTASRLGLIFLAISGFHSTRIWGNSEEWQIWVCTQCLPSAQ